MRVHSEEIQSMYRDFFKAEKNQIEIFRGLRQGFVGFSELEGFQGDGANAAKEYAGEVHVPVIDSFNSALMELEIRMLGLERDFRGSVDSSDIAIIDCQYIEDSFCKKMSAFRTAYKTIHQAGEDAIKEVGFMGFAEVKLSTADDYFEQAYDVAQETIRSVINYPSGFNARHANDLNEIKGTFFPAIDKALAYMRSLRKDGRVVYTGGDVAEHSGDWYGTLNAYNLSAYLYGAENDPDFFDTLYLALAAETGVYLQALYLQQTEGDGFDYEQWIKALHGDTNTMSVTGIGVDATLALGGGDQLAEFLKVIKSGLNFNVTKNAETGNVYLSIVSASGKSLGKAEMLKRLESVGLDFSKIRSQNLSKMFSEGGVLVKSQNPRSYSKIFDLAEGDWEVLANLKNTVKGVDGAAETLGKAGSLLEKLSRRIVILGAIVDGGVDFVDACYDERTNSFSRDNIDAARLTGDVAVDVGQAIATIGTSIVVNAAVGSVVPVAGTIVGVIVGVVLGILNIVEYGEPPESVMDHFKGWVGDRFSDISHAFQKWFW